MGRNRWSDHFLCVIFVTVALTSVLGVEPMLGASQMNELVRRAQCEIKCTEKFATRTNQTLNSGEVVVQFSLSSEEYEQCELGCKNPFSKQGRFSDAFQQGLLFYWQYENSPENTTSTNLTSVTLKCVTMPEGDSTNSQSPPLLSGLLVVKYDEPVSEPVRLIYEIRYRAFSPKLGAYEEQLLRTGLADRQGIWISKTLVPTVQYRFVVRLVDRSGHVSEPVVSEWTEVPSQRFQVHSPVNVSNSDQFVVDGRLNAKIIWSYGNRPLSQASCFYQVSWAADYQAPHSVDFIVDESDGYVLPNLQFDRNYTISLKSISTIERRVERLESDPVGTLIIAKSCRQLIGPNPKICGLGKVTDFSLVELDDKAGSALVSWSPVDSADVLAGYLLYYRSLPVPGQKICPLVLEEYELRLNANASRALLHMNRTSEGCEYVAQIISFDENSNFSPAAQLTFVYPKRRTTQDLSTLFFIVGGVLMSILLLLGVFLCCYLCRQWLSDKCDKWQAIVDKWNMHLMASKTNSSLEPNPLYRLAVSNAVGVRNSTILEGVVELEEGRRLRGGSSESLALTLVPEGSSNTSSTLTAGSSSSSTLTPSSPTTKWTTDSECLCFTSIAVPERNRIGCGKFGDVYLLHCASLRCNVALKSFSQTEGNSEYQRKEVMAAMALARAGHPNIVKMFGVMLTETNEVGGIVFEHCDGGDLKKYLTKTDLLLSTTMYESPGAWERDFSNLLITLCRQVADAMAFISSRGYVHRDLAARNVLLSVTHQSAKLSDFGMARRIDDSDTYRPLTDGVLPYKWMPPETFERILPDGSRRVGDFLKKSDVWSFGALLIEVVSLGKDPEVVTSSSKCHPMILKESPRRMLQSVTSRRNELDRHLRNRLVPVISDCWRWEEFERPTFQELTERLMTLLQ